MNGNLLTCMCVVITIPRFVELFPRVDYGPCKIQLLDASATAQAPALDKHEQTSVKVNTKLLTNLSNGIRYNNDTIPFKQTPL